MRTNELALYERAAHSPIQNKKATQNKNTQQKTRSKTKQSARQNSQQQL